MRQPPILMLTGMPGVRKTLVAEYLRDEFGLPLVSLSHAIRDELVRRGEDLSAENYERVAVELRENDGEAAVALRSLAAVEGHGSGLVVDGLRSPAEAELLKQRSLAGALLIAVVAPRRARYGRIASQNPTRVDYDWIERQDEHNLRLGVGDCIAMADCYVAHFGDPDLRAVKRAVESALGQRPAGER